jgi:predicted permease
MEGSIQDLRYGIRMLFKSPSFTVAVVLTLALGIGANTAIFSLMDAVLLKMLPVKHPEQLVFLEGSSPQGLGPSSNLSYAWFEQIRRHHEVLCAVCTFSSGLLLNANLNGQAQMAEAEQVSGSYFAVLGVNAFFGRSFTDDDDKVPGGHPVAMISYSYWQRRFERDPAIVGKTISLNGHPFTIIGVTPPEFFGTLVGSSTDIWVPIMMRAQTVPGGTIEEYFNEPLGVVLARLKPGVTEQQASAVLTGLWQQSLAVRMGSQLSAEKQRSLREQRIGLRPASRGLSELRDQFSEPLHVLMTVVGLVLLIACANVAGLLLSRATARRGEIAVRLALGASRWQLTRQLLTESMLLAIVGGALGLLVAWWGSDLLLALVSSGRIPIFLKLTLDGRILGFTAAVSLLAGILFGLVPALRTTSLDLATGLKVSGGVSGGASRLGLGKALVIVQVALSFVLVIGAGLFVRSLEKLKSLDAGFNRENVLLFSTDPRMIGYQGSQIAHLYQQVLERLATIPGVRSVSLSRQGLLSGSGTQSSMYVQGRTPHPDENITDGQGTSWNVPAKSEVGPRFFETLGISILRGRDFGPQDTEQAPKVAVINETFARYYFGNDDPIGRRFGSDPEISGAVEIVGVVKDAKYDNLREQIPRTFYVPYLQAPGSWRETNFQIRTVGDPSRIVAAVRQAVQAVDKNLPVTNLKTLATQVDESLMQERLIGTLSGFFGLLSLVLAAIGLYGLMAYAVSQRTHEIGIRMALGGQRRDVLWLVLKEALRLVLIGMSIGLFAALAASRLIANQLFGLTPSDPKTFALASLLLVAVAAFAGYLPAKRASKVDPMVALRYE